MSRTGKFVLIVTIVSGITAFILSALVAQSTVRAGPTFIGVVFGMAVGIVFLLLTGNRKVPVVDAETRRQAFAGLDAADGKARVLVVRQAKLGVMVGVDVLVDDVVFTQLKSPALPSSSSIRGSTDSSLRRRARRPNRRRWMCPPPKRRSSASRRASAA